MIRNTPEESGETNWKELSKSGLLKVTFWVVLARRGSHLKLPGSHLVDHNSFPLQFGASEWLMATPTAYEPVTMTLKVEDYKKNGL